MMKPSMLRSCIPAALLLLAFSPLSAELIVDSDFPGGSGTVVEVDQKTQFLKIDPDDHPGKGWRCWWYVRLSGLTPGMSVTLDVGDAPWATPDQATFSIDDGKTWLQSEPGKREGRRIHYTLSFDHESALVAWGPPFVPSDAVALVNRLADRCPEAAAFTLCRTRENRDTPALRIGPRVEQGTDATTERRPLIWIEARQHAWESGSSWVAQGVGEWLCSNEPEARRIRREYETVLVPIMDIDNVHRGAGGKSQRPQDHNRDWSDEPHWRAVAAAQLELRAAANEGRLAAFIDLHNPGANNLEPYFYVTPPDILSESARSNHTNFFKIAKETIVGPLRFKGRTVESGPKYDPKAWQFISKNWVARLGTSAVSVTLETPWNTPASTTEGYRIIGRQVGMTLARYLKVRQSD